MLLELSSLLIMVQCGAKGYTPLTARKRLGHRLDARTSVKLQPCLNKLHWSVFLPICPTTQHSFLHSANKSALVPGTVQNIEESRMN